MKAQFACPRCGSTCFFILTGAGRKIIFQMNGMYLPIAFDEELQRELDHLEPKQIRCASCTWDGGIRELFPAKEETGSA